MAEARAAALVHAPLGDIETRFLALESHPSLPQLLRHRPRTSRAAASMMGQSLFGLVFTGFSLLLFVTFAAMGGLLAIFPLGFMGLGVLITLTGMRKAQQYRSAPLERMRAAVVDERLRVSGGGENTRAATTYFASLHFPAGDRREFEVSEETAGSIAPGDVGIAFLKGSLLVDFLRVDV
jgi:hypothetical protein